MNGLLRKELCGLRLYRMFLIIGGIVLFVLGLFQRNDSFFPTSASILAMLAMIISINSIAYDQNTKWNCYALSMPYQKRDLVRIKYLYAAGLSIGGVLLSLLASLLVNPLGLTSFGLASAALICGACFMVIALFFPLMYRYGVERARLLIVLVALLPSIGVGIFNGFDVSTIAGLGIPFSVAAPVVLVSTILLLALSYLLSVRIFEKQDL